MNKKALAVAISGAVSAPMAAQAIDVNLSGEIHRAIMWADDGRQSDVFFVDNTASASRFRLTGSQDIRRGSSNQVIRIWLGEQRPVALVS